MQSAADGYTLSNGVRIPCLGFGTWQAPEGETAVTAVREALAAGYRHIDTAACYGNERSVGRAVRESGLPREELFITSKLWNTDHGYEQTRAAFDATMERLGLDVLDLYLIHWPNPACIRDCWEEKNADSWRAMEELYEQGRVRAIGVSNFRPHHLSALMKTARIAPMVNQLRLCPGELPRETVDWCRNRGILLEGYSPLGCGEVFRVPEMRELAGKYRKTVAQLCLRWSLQNGFLPLPKSVSPSRMRENLEIFDFALSQEDMELLTHMPGCGVSQDPDTAGF